MKRLERYMPIAIDVVEDLFWIEECKVDPEFDNLASRFGVAVRQLGLKTAVMAFSPKIEGQDNHKPVDRKIQITKAILRIIQLDEDGTHRTLKELVLSESNNPILKSKIIDASIALKLALRLYIENEDKPNEKKEEPDHGNNE